MGVSLTVRLEDRALATLDEVAAGRSVSREDLLASAVADYLAFEAEQLAKIRDGIAAADRGDFASPAEVEALFSRYREA